MKHSLSKSALTIPFILLILASCKNDKKLNAKDSYGDIENYSKTETEKPDNYVDIFIEDYGLNPTLIDFKDSLIIELKSEINMDFLHAAATLNGDMKLKLVKIEPGKYRLYKGNKNSTEIVIMKKEQDGRLINILKHTLKIK